MSFVIFDSSLIVMRIYGIVWDIKFGLWVVVQNYSKVFDVCSFSMFDTHVSYSMKNPWLGLLILIPANRIGGYAFS